MGGERKGRKKENRGTWRRKVESTSRGREGEERRGERIRKSVTEEGIEGEGERGGVQWRERGEGGQGDGGHTWGVTGGEVKTVNRGRRITSVDEE